LSKGQHEAAVVYAQRCLTVKPKSKDCETIRRTAARTLLPDLRQRLRLIPEDDLYTRRAAVERIYALDPANALYDDAARALSVRLNTLAERALAYVGILHSTVAPEPLPDELRRYLNTVPEVMFAAAESAAHETLATADIALAHGDFEAAYSMLKPVAAHREAEPVLIRISDVARASLTQEVNALSLGDRIPTIEQFVESRLEIL
jgi:hypothetical protein